MRVVWLTGLAACLAVQGCAPSPGSYYGAPPGYAPQPYAAVPGGVAQQEPDPGYADPSYADPSYAQPGYAPPAALTPEPGYYTPPPAYGYAAPPLLPLAGFYGSRDRFDRGRFERERIERERAERGRFERERMERDRGREQFERERFERSRFRERAQMERLRPPPQPVPAQVLQGPAHPHDFRHPPEGEGRHGLSPGQWRGLR